MVVVKTPLVASSVSVQLDSLEVVMGSAAWVSMKFQNTLRKLLKNMEYFFDQGILSYEPNTRMYIKTVTT